MHRIGKTWDEMEEFIMEIWMDLMRGEKAGKVAGHMMLSYRANLWLVVEGSSKPRKAPVMWTSIALLPAQLIWLALSIDYGFVARWNPSTSYYKWKGPRALFTVKRVLEARASNY